MPRQINKDEQIVQSILIDKNLYSKSEAKKMLADSGFSAILDINEDGNYYRARQINPSEINKNSFRTWHTIPGVKLIIGKLK